jgi:hypothetical protein
MRLNSYWLRAADRTVDARGRNNGRHAARLDDQVLTVNGNGAVDGGDLQVWKAGFGQPGTGALAVQTVPEPHSLVLVAAVALLPFRHIGRAKS